MKVVIFGAGQTGKMVYSILSNDHQIVGYVDDVVSSGGEVLGGKEWLLNNKNCYDSVCVGAGTIPARKFISEWLNAHEIKTISAIHKSAIICEKVTLGENLVVGANVTLYVNPSIGEGCFIGPGVTVSHDTTVGNYCLLSVGSIVGARCDIGDEVLVGSGAVLMPPAFDVRARLDVGLGAIIGVGSVVIKDVPTNVTVVGNPAKPIASKK